MRALALLALAGVVLSGAAASVAGPEPASLYAPVPPEIGAILVSEHDQALASMALASLEEPALASRDLARAQLVLLDDAGLRAAAGRLAAGGVPAHAAPQLLQVVASSEHESADVLLERAAGDPRPVMRMIAADGLGRGRSARAVPALAKLARDDVPGVRIAALRSLFALESPQAVAARRDVPVDPEPDLLAARLRWHYRCEDTWPRLRDIAVDAYRRSEIVALRMEAAQLLTLPLMETPADLLVDIVREMGSNALGARLVRWARGHPQGGYDAVTMRRVAIDAALTLLEREGVEAATRTWLVDRAVGWVARPVPMDPYKKGPIPEDRLRRRLPDLGSEIVEPIVRRLRAHSFYDARAGTILLRELGAETALPILRDLIAPPAERDPFESRREAQARRNVRIQASGAVQELGRIEDEALARALLLGDEPHAFKVDIVRSLARDPGAWVVPLLGELTGSELRSYALDILEARLEPEARALLVEDLFEHMERPEDRMQPLVARVDEAALETLARALADERRYMRHAALYQFNRRINPRLCGRAGRLLLRTFEPDFGVRRETQDYVKALVAAEPVEAVRFVRENWAKFPTLPDRMTKLRQLQDVQGTAARSAAVDFALEHGGAGASAEMCRSVGAVLRNVWDHRAEEVLAFWRRMLASEDRSLRWMAIGALDSPGAPDMTDVLLPLLETSLESKVPDDAAESIDEQMVTAEIVQALRHQPAVAVESVLIDVALDPFVLPSTRWQAAQSLIGRLGDAGRERLLVWMGATAEPGDEAPPSATEDSGLQRLLAIAVGEGASPQVAARLHGLLEREIDAFYTEERLARLEETSFDEIDAGAPNARAAALASGIGYSRHVPTVGGLLDLVFDLRFARYARIAGRRSVAHLQGASSSAAARAPAPIEWLAAAGAGGLPSMPSVLYEVLSQVKALDDDDLAAALARVLGAAKRDGRLAQFPDHYLRRAYVALMDRPTGAKPKSADVIYRAMRRLEAIDGPVDYDVEQGRVTELGIDGRFREAAEAQRAAVRIFARGGYGDGRPWVWHWHRARLDALEGSVFATQGLNDQAHDRFRRAVLRAPNDPGLLNMVAWERALAGFELEHAEADALRATILEARVDNRPTLDAADTLAYVLLKRGKPNAAIEVLGPRMKMPAADRNGRLHFHMAQCYAAAGFLADASESLVQALTWDRALDAKVESDFYLAPLRKGDRLARIRQAAAEGRIRDNL